MSSSTMSTGKENVSGPCKVCGKPGHGIHYGVWSCEPCKRFFARYEKMGSKNLVCYFNSDCDLSVSKPRIVCGYCRFQKCVKVGMTRNIPNLSSLDGQVQRVLTPDDMVSQLPSHSSNSQSSKLMEVGDDSQTDQIDLSKLRELREINDIVDSYKEGCCFTTDKIKHFTLKDFQMVNSQSVELARVKAWTDYVKEYETDIRALLPFIDELQDSFNSHDKAILLKRSAFQLYFLRRVRALNPYGLLLSDGRVIKMVDLQFLYGIPLTQEMLQIVNKILLLGCTDDDLAMFTTIVYYKPGNLEDLEHLNLENPENLAPAQQKFKTLFVKHAENRGADQRVFHELIKLWPEMERLKVMHQEMLAFLKPYRWAFPENSLFAEVYDLDSKIDTVQTESNLPSSSSATNGSS